MVKDEGKVLAAEYRTELPDTKLLEAELQKTRRILEERREQQLLTSEEPGEPAGE